MWGQAQGPRGRGLGPRLLRPGLTWMCRGRGGCGFSCEPHVHTEKPPSQHPRSCLSAGPVSSFGFLPGLWPLGWWEGAPAGDLLRAAVWQPPWLSASPPSPGPHTEAGPQVPRRRLPSEQVVCAPRARAGLRSGWC